MAKNILTFIFGCVFFFIFRYFNSCTIYKLPFYTCVYSFLTILTSLVCVCLSVSQYNYLSACLSLFLCLSLCNSFIIFVTIVFICFPIAKCHFSISFYTERPCEQFCENNENITHNGFLVQYQL